MKTHLLAKGLPRVARQFVGAAAFAALVITSIAQANAQTSKRIKNVIVIYQENWSFDALYGLFPNANGLANASQTSLTQIDRLTGQPYSLQLGQPFDLVSGSVALTTPPQ